MTSRSAQQYLSTKGVLCKGGAQGAVWDLRLERWLLDAARDTIHINEYVHADIDNELEAGGSGARRRPKLHAAVLDRLLVGSDLHRRDHIGGDAWWRPAPCDCSSALARSPCSVLIKRPSPSCCVRNQIRARDRCERAKAAGRRNAQRWVEDHPRHSAGEMEACRRCW